MTGAKTNYIRPSANTNPNMAPNEVIVISIKIREIIAVWH
jgi:hypothetical protein